MIIVGKLSRANNSCLPSFTSPKASNHHRIMKLSGQNRAIGMSRCKNPEQAQSLSQSRAEIGLDVSHSTSSLRRDEGRSFFLDILSHGTTSISSTRS